MTSSQRLTPQQRSDNFMQAVRRLDPYLLANAIQVPPINPVSSPNSPTLRKLSALSYVSDDGVDWSSVVVPWLDACQAAEEVSETDQQHQ
jgi:hypothetical protein